MPSAQDFQGVTASVFASQSAEVSLSKQSALSEQGNEVRTAINQLPSNVSSNLLSAYQAPSQSLMTEMSNAIASRELAIDNAIQGNNLDSSWLSQNDGNDKAANSASLSSLDEWNKA